MTARILMTVLLAACGSKPTADAADAAPAAPIAAPAPAPAEAVAEPEAAPAAPTEVGPADAAAGAVVYTTYCQACHQADGSGMNGMLAANFRKDGRLDKTDEQLLTSIGDGFTGKVGTMPPWKGTLTDQDMVNVLAHVRKTYGE